MNEYLAMVGCVLDDVPIGMYRTKAQAFAALRRCTVVRLDRVIMMLGRLDASSVIAGVVVQFRSGKPVAAWTCGLGRLERTTSLSFDVKAIGKHNKKQMKPIK